jgi:hypothetical protein
MTQWGDCRIEVIARQKEILALAEDVHGAAAIHRKLQLACSLRSLQRWLRHLKTGKPVVEWIAPPKLKRDGFRRPDRPSACSPAKPERRSSLPVNDKFEIKPVGPENWE